MLQTCKHDAAKLIFKKFYFFSLMILEKFALVLDVLPVHEASSEVHPEAAATQNTGPLIEMELIHWNLNIPNKESYSSICIFPL